MRWVKITSTNLQIWNCRSIAHCCWDACTIYAKVILCMCPTNGRWCYNVTPLIGWAHTQNYSCIWIFSETCYTFRIVIDVWNSCFSSLFTTVIEKALVQCVIIWCQIFAWDNPYSLAQKLLLGIIIKFQEKILPVCLMTGFRCKCFRGLVYWHGLSLIPACYIM